jgi:hypothetical protein
VSVSDLEGIEHTVEVTAATLYEAAAAALAAFRDDEWVEQIGNGLTTVSVSVQQPAVEHHVRVKDFLARLNKKAVRLLRSRSEGSSRKCWGESHASTKAQK